MDDMLEVLPAGASKGVGVAKLMEALGIDARDTMAMGDAENDVQMLRSAGLSVVMGNGKASAKSAARYVTRPNGEDGAAHALSTVLGLTIE